MDRLACVDVPALPLQLLLRRHPRWADRPAAVIDRDSPQGVLLWVNGKAFRRRILPGQRYATALSLAADLRADVVPAGEIDGGIQTITHLLQDFTPDVEASRELPGVFWLNAAGLERVHPSLACWAEEIHRRLTAERFHARVAVGFTRFGTYAGARARQGTTVFPDAGEEQGFARQVPLAALDVEPALREAVAGLGIRTVGDFLALPPAGVRDRFGKEAHALHRLAAGDLRPPLQVAPHLETIREMVEFGFLVTNVSTLVFFLKRTLEPLLATLAAGGRALEELEVLLVLERGGTQAERIRPAAPTLDAALLLDLVVLRLESLALDGGVEEAVLTIQAGRIDREQLTLFQDNRRRDLKAARRAFDRLRAAFGDGVVVRARLREGHLPEANFTWEPLAEIGIARPRDVLLRPLVRRIEAAPLPLASHDRRPGNDGWLKHGAVVACSGPYVVSGGWWSREVHREYHYARTLRGDLLWVYFDRQRRRWFQQGRVE